MSTSSAPLNSSKDVSPQLSVLVNSLSSIDNSTKQTQTLLESFSERHKNLASSIDSFHERIGEWKVITVNIDETIERIESIRQRFVDVRSLSLQKPSLELLDKIIQLQSYFEKHQSFQDVPSTLEKLKELRLKSITHLEDLFKKKIGSDKVLEDKDIELIARRLHYLNVWSYRKCYIDVRKKILKISLFGSKKNDVMRKVAMSVATAGSHNKLKNQDRFYQSGSHTFIKLIDDFIEGLKREREILNLCIFESGKKPSKKTAKEDAIKVKKLAETNQNNEDPVGMVDDHRTVDQIFEDVVQKSKRKFFERAAATGDDVKQSERVFVLLDVLNHYEKRLRDFDPVISREELNDLQKQLRQKISSHLEEYKGIILSMAKADSSEPGQVHQVTSNTFLLFHRLLLYTDTVENLLNTEFFSDSSLKKKSKTFFGRYMRHVIEHATEKALESISTHEKVKSIKLLFLLNNHQYILEKLQSEEFEPHIHESYIAQYDLICKNNTDDFLNTAWKPLEETLINLNEVEVLKKNDKLTKKWKTAVKNRFKTFNSRLNSINTQHSSYKISNPKTGTELRMAAEEMICDKYTKFFNKYSKLPFSKKHMQKYLEFNPDTVQGIIRQLYK